MGWWLAGEAGSAEPRRAFDSACRDRDLSFLLLPRAPFFLFVSKARRPLSPLCECCEMQTQETSLKSLSAHAAKYAEALNAMTEASKGMARDLGARESRESL